MMSSLGGEKARGPRDKVLPTATHNTQPQKQLQATAEQIRLAQMIYDKNDADFEDKVNQLMEVSGKNQDECMVALHDCNEDINRAINWLLESTSDTTSWETVGKKKPLVKDCPSSENKENREKRAEREGSRARGGAGRRGKAANRTRQARPEENGVQAAPVDRGAERGPRGRGGRGPGGRGRGRAPAGSRFSAQGMGTFNPADYTTEAGSRSKPTDVWEAGANSSTDVAWKSSLEDWAAEDWSEELSETKVFTSSSAPAAENHITPGQSLDLDSLLQKPAGEGREEQSLVFTNSHHHQQQQPSHTSYAHAALSSVLGSAFVDPGQSKRSASSAGAQILEQLKGPGLGPLPSSQAAPPPSTASIGRLPGLRSPGPTPSSTSSSSWDMKAPELNAASLTSLPRDFALQPEPSLVLSQLVQRQASPPTQPPAQPLTASPTLYQASPPTQQAPPALPLTASASPTLYQASTPAQATARPPVPSTGPEPSQQHQRAQLKGQKRRIPPTSKIPSTAVEMPGSADIPGLNLQFGALDFGSEATLPTFGRMDNCVGGALRECPPAPASPPASAPQSQSSLYSKPLSESLGSPPSVPLSLPSSEPIYPSPSVALPSLTPSSLATVSSVNPASSSSIPSSAPPFCSVGGSFDGSIPSHSRLAFSQSKEAPGPIMNGLNGVRTPAALDTSSASSTPKPESPSLSVSSSNPGSHLASMPPHSTSTLTALNSHASHSHSSVLGSSSLSAYTSVENSSSSNSSVVSSLAPSGSFSAPAGGPSLHTISSSNSSSMSHLGSMGLGGTAAAVLGLCSNGANTTSNLLVPRAAQLLSSTGKAPPNLSQGVPPLLPNQYIMGPGGILQAYPQIYGYEDLHMLQSRLPMPSLQDYYGITFPGPAAALPGRDGSLASNPYSGEVTKFGRNDSTSPAPPTSLSAGQPPPGPSQAPNQAHSSQQQAFLPPGYSYTGLPAYYPGVPGSMPSAAAFQYGPTMFVPPGGPGPAAAKQHSMGLGLGNPSASPFQQQQQQASSYGQHSFSSGYEELTAGPAGVDYSKGYSNSSQPQAKAAATGPGKGVSVTSSNSGVPDISGSVYNKSQSFDKQGFHTGTPPPFSLPSALGGPGLNPGGAPGGYAPAPFLHILPHQQTHSQLLHHHLAQDGQGGPSQRAQSSSMQQKSQVKSSYGSSLYWAN
ncbi:ubiquitin-associated protein 2a [Aplochiton taeniatus]